ncbi:hypothetical protein AB0F17_18265 [Nonomuraea sp. NPDC026600]|uniref:hypothetical protein n=1 Tax=Nonomuraea sp. NPDC026600 TaxID=3155363 RepID=UPI0033F89C19
MLHHIGDDVVEERVDEPPRVHFRQPDACGDADVGEFAGEDVQGPLGVPGGLVSGAQPVVLDCVGDQATSQKVPGGGAPLAEPRKPSTWASAWSAACPTW